MYGKVKKSLCLFVFFLLILLALPMHPVQAGVRMDRLKLNYGMRQGKTYTFKTRLPRTKKNITIKVRIRSIRRTVKNNRKVLTIQYTYSDILPKLTKSEVDRIIEEDYYPDIWDAIIDGSSGYSYEDDELAIDMDVDVRVRSRWHGKKILRYGHDGDYIWYRGQTVTLNVSYPITYQNIRVGIGGYQKPVTASLMEQSDDYFVGYNDLAFWQTILYKANTKKNSIWIKG